MFPSYCKSHRQGQCAQPTTQWYRNIDITAIQAFLSFFFKQYKRKKAPAKIAGTERKRGHTATAPSTRAPPPDDELVLDGGDELSIEDQELAETLAEDDISAPDTAGQDVHDEKVVDTLRVVAIRQMEDQGIRIGTIAGQEALKLFPKVRISLSLCIYSYNCNTKVAGLATRVNDSGTLKAIFDSRVTENPTLEGDKRALDRRVPTRWNSEGECLDAHIHFRSVIESMTSTTELRLQSYKLTDDQWNLSYDVSEVLEVRNFCLKFIIVCSLHFIDISKINSAILPG